MKINVVNVTPEAGLHTFQCSTRIYLILKCFCNLILSYFTDHFVTWHVISFDYVLSIVIFSDIFCISHIDLFSVTEKLTWGIASAFENIHCIVILTLAYSFYKYLLFSLVLIGPTFHILCVNITSNQTFNHKHYKTGKMNDA